MRETLLETLNHHPVKRYLIGFSGGRDSHVLLDGLIKLRDTGELTTLLKVIHINHHLHPQSDDWVYHCQAVCDAYQVPLIVETVTEKPKAGDSIEAFAREARYRLIKKHLGAEDIFLSAHHQRDQAETFLLQLMRGSGLQGLRAMPLLRPLGQGKYLRPLLDIDYTDIINYAETHHLTFIEDDSNANTRFDRNFLRHEVLPLLESRFPKAIAHIAQSAHWLAEVPEPTPPTRLWIDQINNLSKTEQKQQVRAFIKAKTGQSLSQTQTHYIITHHVVAQTDKHPTLITGDYVIRRHQGEIYVTRVLPKPENRVFKGIQIGKTLKISALVTLAWANGQGGLCCDKPLSLKPLNGSNRFHPHTRHRATTVKKCLSEAKIPVWLRPHYLGLYVDNELVAIPSVGVAHDYYQQSADAQSPLWIILPEFVRL